MNNLLNINNLETKWRFLNFKNVTIDFVFSLADVLLNNIVHVNGYGKPILVLFTAKPAGIVLGKKQNIKQFNINKIKKYNITVVRRHTAGNAVWFDNDIGYGLFIPKKLIKEGIKGKDLFLHFSTKFSLHFNKLFNNSIETSFGEYNVSEYKHPYCFSETGHGEIFKKDMIKFHGGAYLMTSNYYLQEGLFLSDINSQLKLNKFINEDKFKVPVVDNLVIKNSFIEATLINMFNVLLDSELTEEEKNSVEIYKKTKRLL